MKSTDLGVFLHRSVYSESSLIVWFFTRENGVQKFLFRGGKKKAHSLFPMAVCELSYYGHKHSDLFNLTAVETAQPSTFQFNPISSTIAYFCVECAKKCMHQGDVDESVFQFLVNFSNCLDREKNLGILPLQFLVEFSEVLGLKPHFEDEEGRFFNIDTGVFQSSTNSFERIATGPGIDLIKSLIHDAAVTSSTKKIREEALNIMLEYYKIHIPRFDNLETFDVVKEILNA
jgi:DNA repair protein RecO (recombination protein O)